VSLRTAFASLAPEQRSAFLAAFLGWTLDAFDFFLVTFVVVRIAHDFARAIPEVTGAITLTLMFRPLGALIFGWLGDRYGRRVPLMIDVVLYSLLELLTAFAPTFAVFLVLRSLYGIAMGGEWGLGAALAMESLPPHRRGLFSGILQEGYMVGYLLAALANLAVFTLTPWGWRALFALGALPALLVFYIRAHVRESPVWQARARRGTGAEIRVVARAFVAHWPLTLYAILFMAAFNYMSHGTQDLYPTFLEKQRGLGPAFVSLLASLSAVGAIAGGIVFGALSQRYGRRAMIALCAVLGATLVPLWVFSNGIALLALGGFAMQFMVQGAWGIIPAHLNELSPNAIRATFPGFTYQLGNLLSANAAQLEATFAATRFALPGGGADYARALATIALVVFAAVFVLALAGYAIAPERRESLLEA